MGRLKGIPNILSPDLLYAIASMGHGDEIVLADANFPAKSTAKAKNAIFVDASGHDIPSLMEAILQFFPLDTHVFNPVILMDIVNADKKKGMVCPIWKTYQEISDRLNGSPVEIYKMERYDFYERARDAMVMVATGETALYGNVILKKGVVEGP